MQPAGPGPGSEADQRMNVGASIRGAKRSVVMGTAVRPLPTRIVLIFSACLFRKRRKDLNEKVAKFKRGEPIQVKQVCGPIHSLLSKSGTNLYSYGCAIDQ